MTLGNDWPRPDRDEWRDHAACRGMGPDLFFPAKDDVGAIARAKAVCASCPVQGPCLDEAVSAPWGEDVAGIRAGLGPRSRRRLRTERNRRAS